MMPYNGAVIVIFFKLIYILIFEGACILSSQMTLPTHLKKILSFSFIKNELMED